MDNSGLITTKIVQKYIFKINSIINFKNTEQKMMKMIFFLKLGIIQALIYTLNWIFQNTKISTIIYGVCICLLPGINDQEIWPNYEVVGFQASVSDC